MKHSGDHEVEAGWGPALDHWLTGLIFAVGLSVLVVACPQSTPWVGPFIGEIEKRGVDATMRFHAEIGRVTPIGDEAAAVDPAVHRTPPAGYLFIDLDNDTCLDAKGDQRCALRSPASGAAAARVATAILKADPRLVIVDVRLWETDPNAQIGPYVGALMDAARHSDIPVLAPAPASPTGEEGHVFIDWTQMPRALHASRIRFAPALVWPDSSDGMDRSYRAKVLANTFDMADGREAVGVGAPATLPYLAALYSTTPPRDRADADCLAANAPGSCGQTSGGERLPVRAPRIHFTLQAAEASVGTPTRQVARLYSRIPSSQTITESGALSLDSDWITDKIVIIGFSGPRGLDRHITPLGEMSGAELILNATRSFASAPDQEPEQESSPAAVMREIIAAIVSSFPFLLFWRVQSGLWAGAKDRPAKVFAALVTAIAFVATAYVSALLTTAFVLVAWGQQVARGAPVDALLPVAILSLESFAHAAKHVIDVSHNWVSGQRRRLQARFAKPKESPYESAV